MIERNVKNNFFLQKVKTEDVLISREDFLRNLLRGTKVLHVGCTDYPVTNVANNLHVKISPSCLILDGLDLDEEGLKVLKQHVDGDYYISTKEIEKEYDYVLVPEVIEHVGNVCEFLEDLSTINTKKYFITGPCFIGHLSLGFFRYKDFYGNPMTKETEDYIETVHPDHNCWYTPYTLCNIIDKYTSWEINNCYFLENKRMVGVLCSKK